MEGHKVDAPRSDTGRVVRLKKWLGAGLAREKPGRGGGGLPSGRVGAAGSGEHVSYWAVIRAE